MNQGSLSILILILLFPFSWLKADEPESEKIIALLENSSKRSLHIQTRIANAVEALEISRKIGNDSLLAESFYMLGDIYRQENKYTKSNSYFTKADSLYHAYNYQSHRMMAAYKLGSNNLYQGNFKLAEEFFERALTLAVLKNDTSAQASFQENMAILKIQQGLYADALTNLQQAIGLVKASTDTFGIIHITNEIGKLHQRTDKYKLALSYSKNALRIAHEANIKRFDGMIFNSIGNAYLKMEQLDSAQYYLRMAYKLSQERGHKVGVAKSLLLLGGVYKAKKDYASAQAHFEQALKIEKKIGAKHKIGKVYFSMADLHHTRNNVFKALQAMKKAEALFLEVNGKTELEQVYMLLADWYAEIQRYKEAYMYKEKYIKLHDSLQELANEQLLNQLEQRYSEAQTKQELKLKEAELSKTEAELKRRKIKERSQRLGLFAMGAILALGIFAFTIRRRSTREIKKRNKYIEHKNKELNKKNEAITKQHKEMQAKSLELERRTKEITKQRDEISRQRNTLMHQTKELTDSMLYARYIQRAILPSQTIFEKYIKDYFITFKPKDIVSGDFYWIKHIDGITYLAAVDCSGHGVPGGFMSMLGTAFLNEIVDAKSKHPTDEVLNELRDYIKEALAQKDEREGTREGMEMTFCAIDHKNYIMQYSGSFNSPYLIRNGELNSLPVDRQPVAIYFDETPFSRRELHLEPGDSIYLYTDGFHDQFGGEKGKKYKVGRFQNLLLQIHQEEMALQSTIINRTLNDWMDGRYEQVDDILIIGFRVRDDLNVF